VFFKIFTTIWSWLVLEYGSWFLKRLTLQFGYLVIIVFGHLQKPLIDSRDFLNKIAEF